MPRQPEEPAEGYFLEVKFNGFDRPNTNTERPSTNTIEFNASLGAGNRVKYNYKYEYRPPTEPTPAPGELATPRPCDLLGTGNVDGLGPRWSRKPAFRRCTIYDGLQQPEPRGIPWLCPGAVSDITVEPWP